MNLVKTRKLPILILVMLLITLLAIPALASGDASQPQAAETAAEAQTEAEGSSTGLKALAVGIAIGLAAAGGMGIVGGKAADGISRQPDMEGKIRTTLMLDLVFIETAIIYALLVVILVIFVL